MFSDRIWYDSIRKRIVLGTRRDPKQFIPDSQVGILNGINFYTATLPAIGAASGARALATLAAAGAAVGDHVVVNPRVTLTLGLNYAFVPSGGEMIYIYLDNLAGATATQPITRWDAAVIKSE